jgi:putative membrane protein
MTTDLSPQDRQLQLAEERTRAAARRTRLAEERTYSAWVRTGLASAAAGLGIVKLLGDTEPRWLIHALGTLFVLVGGVMFAIGFWAYRRASRALEIASEGGLPLWVLGWLSAALLVGAGAGLWLVWRL